MPATVIAPCAAYVTRREFELSAAAQGLRSVRDRSHRMVISRSAGLYDLKRALAIAYRPGDIVVVPPCERVSWRPRRGVYAFRQAGVVDWSTGGGVDVPAGVSLVGPGKDAGSPTTIAPGSITMNRHASEINVVSGLRLTGSGDKFFVDGSSGLFAVLHDCYMACSSSHSFELHVNGFLAVDCDFDGPLSLLQSGGNAMASTLGNSQAASDAWSNGSTMGDLDTTGYANSYFEDCIFTNYRDGLDVDDGSKVVVRQCTANDSTFITHGGGSGGSGNDSSIYGGVSLEVYDNTFNRVSTGIGDGPINRWYWLRGGSGVLANNVMDEANAPPHWNSGEQVRMSVGNCAAGYPRQYQVGQSTQTVDSTPDEPVLIYGNTGFGVPVDEISRGANPNTTCSNPTAMIVEDRDYILSADWWTAYVYPHPVRAALGLG